MYFSLFFNNVYILVDVVIIYIVLFQFFLCQWDEFLLQEVSSCYFLVVKLGKFGIDIKFGGFDEIVLCIFLFNFRLDIRIGSVYVYYSFQLESSVGYFINNGWIGRDDLVFNMEMGLVIWVYIIVGVVLLVYCGVVNLQGMQFGYFFF